MQRRLGVPGPLQGGSRFVHVAKQLRFVTADVDGELDGVRRFGDGLRPAQLRFYDVPTGTNRAGTLR